MGYNELDLALIDAWERAYQRFKNDPAKLDRVLRRFGGSTYTRPLRSWALVLRANDQRIPDDNTQGLVRVDAECVRTCCAPVHIEYPGVSLDDAALRFGVNRTTVSRWASPPELDPGKSASWWRAVCQQMQAVGGDERFGRPSVFRVVGKRLMLEHEYNRANPRRSATRVWTPGIDGIDPGGEVWSGEWGSLRVGLADRVPAGFVQQLARVDRLLAKTGSTGRCASPATRLQSRVMQWVCPAAQGGCGALVYKLYLPMPSWTLMRALGAGAGAEPAWDASFLCQRCAGLLYESAERTASPGTRRGGGRRQVDAWDRFIKRISGGVLAGREVKFNS